MPSFQHAALLLLFRNQPRLAPQLLRDLLHCPLPQFTECRVEAADLTDIQPAEYRADLVVLLLDGRPVLGIVVEVQLQRDDAKAYAWPVYVVNLRARTKCPVCLLVIAPDEQVARWAAAPIELGGGQRFTPYVMCPTMLPTILDLDAAKADPELAVFSVMAHGRRAEPVTSAQMALAAIVASAGLDADRADLYVDLVMNSISEAARRALQAMKPANYEYQSEFARRYFFEGKAEGRVEGEAEGRHRGRAELLIKLMTLKFGPLAAPVEAGIRAAATAQLDAMAERLLVATALDQVTGNVM